MATTTVYVERAHQYIAFPRSPEAIFFYKITFFRMAGFPNVPGAVSSIHIPISTPKDSKTKFRITPFDVQVTCDAGHFITDVYVRYPWSCMTSLIYCNQFSISYLTAKQLLRMGVG